MQRILILLYLIGSLSLSSGLLAKGGSFTNEAFLAEIRTKAKKGDLAAAKEMARTNLASAVVIGSAMEQIIGHLYLANLELIDGFDTNAAAAQLEKMRQAVTCLPKRVDFLKMTVLLAEAGRISVLSRMMPEAESCYQLALDTSIRAVGNYHLTTSALQGRLGTVQLEMGDLESGAANLQEALATIKKGLAGLIRPGRTIRMPEENLLSIQILMSDYANFLRRQQNYEDESDQLGEYLQFLGHCYGKNSAADVPVLLRLGYNHEVRKSHSKARKYFENAARLGIKHRVDYSRLCRETLIQVHEYFRRNGRLREQKRIAEQLEKEPIASTDSKDDVVFLRSRLHSYDSERLEKYLQSNLEKRQKLILDLFVDE